MNFQRFFRLSLIVLMYSGVMEGGTTLPTTAEVQVVPVGTTEAESNEKRNKGQTPYSWVDFYDAVLEYLLERKISHPNERLRANVPRNVNVSKAFKVLTREDGENILMHRVKGQIDEWREVVRDESRKRDIFGQFHRSAYGGHHGNNKTLGVISQRYYWASMTDDIKKWTSACEICERNRDIKAPAPLKSIKVVGPWHMLGVDLTGPLVETKNGNKFILTCTDFYTKWVEAFPIPEKTAPTVAKCLLEVFYRHGASHYILTDQGREFVNEVNRSMCASLGVQHKITAAYHPQTNGLDEKTNGNIKRKLAKLVNDEGDNWDEMLGPTLFSLRTAPHCSTKYSPFRLLYHREAKFPIEMESVPLELETPPKCPNDTEILKDFEAREKRDHSVIEQVLANIAKAQERQATNYNKRKVRPAENIQVGDKVWRQNSRRAAHHSGSLEPRRHGPYIVTNITGKLCQLCSLDGSKPLKVKYSLDHIKKYIEGQYWHQIRNLGSHFCIGEKGNILLHPLAVPLANEPSCQEKSQGRKAMDTSSEPVVMQKTNIVRDETVASPPRDYSNSLKHVDISDFKSVSMSDLETSKTEMSTEPSCSFDAACHSSSSFDLDTSNLVVEIAGPNLGIQESSPNLQNGRTDSDPASVPTARDPSSSSAPPPRDYRNSLKHVDIRDFMSVSMSDLESSKTVLDEILDSDADFLEAKVASQLITGRSLRALVNGGVVDDAVMNALVSKIARSDPAKSIKHIDIHVMNDILFCNTMGYSMQKLKMDIYGFDLLITAFNDPRIPAGFSRAREHWCCAVIDPFKAEISYFDPLGHSATDRKLSDEFLTRWREFLRRTPSSGGQIFLMEDPETWEIVCPPHTTQTDSTSCGPLAVEFLRRCIAGESLTAPVDITRLRRNLAINILAKSDDDLHHYCRACKHTMAANEQIKCLTCPRRFHQQCLQHGSCLVCVEGDPLPSITVAKNRTQPPSTSLPSLTVAKTRPQPPSKSKPSHHQVVSITRRVKRCQGCRKPFDFSRFSLPLAIRVYENNPFVRSATGESHDAWRNYYYHLNRSCIKKCGRVGIDDGLQLSESDIEAIEKAGFVLV